MARRAFRRRRKPVEWVRTSIEGAGSTTHHCTLHFDGSTAQVIDVSNIIIGDEPYATESLIEERKTYVIDRIVGRLRWSLTGSAPIVGPEAGNYTVPPVHFRWGVFVGETDQDGNILDLDRWDLFTTSGHEVDWIMRDSYIAGAGYGYNYNGLPYSGCTPFNAAAWQFTGTGTYEAPWAMVDTRAKRRVGQEERLFLQCAVAKADNAWDYSQGPCDLTVFTDLRVLLHWTAGTNRR